MKNNFKMIMTLAFLAVFGISTFALADWGYGYDHMTGRGMMGGGMMSGGMMGHGMMRHGMMNNGSQQGCGYYGNLSADEIAKLDQQRSEFFKATEGIRQQLYENQIALQSELSKENPDSGKASKLQSEISKLQGELDQMGLDHEMKVRKSVPNYNRGYWNHGSMMGYTANGNGHHM